MAQIATFIKIFRDANFKPNRLFLFELVSDIEERTKLRFSPRWSLTFNFALKNIWFNDRSKFKIAELHEEKKNHETSDQISCHIIVKWTQ